MTRLLILPLTLLALSGCTDRGAGEGDAGDNAMPSNQTQSVFRDEVRNEIEEPLEDEAPRELTIGFPEGGSELDAAAVEALSGFLSPDWVSGDAPVRLWGHSDTVGSDAQNFEAGEARARAVADYLEANGVRPERITIVSLGEGNPVEPNYLPDGSDNEAGQRANRRVEMMVGGMPEADGEPVDGSQNTT
ncbi:OmpA family protein [Sphingomicrobium flavum]|uniref:OmpA family protein n=1 Tax=Sphingomicrobium flavum TaxID=1229164 RepID=UPI0021AD563B|nr:OmpA family protein [Sphingomicrobium flavum]